MPVYVMAAADTIQLVAKRFDYCAKILEPDVMRAGQYPLVNLARAHNAKVAAITCPDKRLARQPCE